MKLALFAVLLGACGSVDHQPGCHEYRLGVCQKTYRCEQSSLENRAKFEACTASPPETQLSEAVCGQRYHDLPYQTCADFLSSSPLQ